MISKAENIDDLTRMIDSLLQKEQDYLAEINRLKEQINALRNQLFGRKSEKTFPDDNQLSLFEPPEELFPIAEALEEELMDIPRHQRKKRGRKPIPDNLPRVDCCMT